MKDSWNEESRGVLRARERTTALCFHDGPAESILVYVTTKPPSRHDVTFDDHIDFCSRKSFSSRSKVPGILAQKRIDLIRQDFVSYNEILIDPIRFNNNVMQK